MHPTRNIRRLARASLFALGLLASFASLRAHNLPGSAVMLDFQRDGVEAELTLPLADLETAVQKPLLVDPAKALKENRDALKAYLAAHLDPQTETGQKWSVTVQSLEAQTSQEPFDVIAHIWLQPPSGATPRKFVLNYSVITREVASHHAFVSVRNDWDTAVFSSRPEPVGDIHLGVTSLSIDRTRGSWRQGFRTVFNLGLRHIAEGTDHLLFLLVLLLPAPLLARGKCWGEARGVRESLWQLLKIVSAFTIGHSLTLLVGALGLVHWPEAPIEVLIAVSIFVSAIHAVRPWFAGRESYIAGGFGLIHGLAFASSLSEFNFSTWSMLSTVFSFNLGIETMQLVVVGTAIPWLLLLSRTRFYSLVRITGAVFAGIASLGWIVERSFDLDLHVDSVVNLFAIHAGWIVMAVAAFSLAALAWTNARKKLVGTAVPSGPTTVDSGNSAQ